MMADRGITFSAAMVRALLEGRKTQTRRLVPEQTCWRDDGSVWTGFMGWQDRAWAFENRGAVGRGVLPPHQPGDRLYVREHWKVDAYYDPFAPSELTELDSFDGTVCYLATAPAESLRDPVWGRHRQAMHMPRWASRLTLLVTDVRVQRLRDISEADAAAEGAYRGKASGRIATNHTAMIMGYWYATARNWYRDLWNTLHTAPGTRWEDNPWITAISFTVKHGNIDQIGGEA